MEEDEYGGSGVFLRASLLLDHLGEVKELRVFQVCEGVFFLCLNWMQM
jgi:hypothetical protein